MEKARHRQQAIDQASASVTQRIFDQQSDLKRNFLDEISLAGMHERDSLQHWRRVILLNTHPRYWGSYNIMYMYNNIQWTTSMWT